VMFRIDWFETLIKWLLVRVKYISLPNLIADRMVLPEWIITGNPDASVEQITNTLSSWLSNPAELAAAKVDLENLSAKAIQTGANSRAADAILAALEAQEMRRAA